MMHRTALIFFLILFNFEAIAKIYKWVDENGVSHYSENKPENIQHKEVKIENSANKQIDQITQVDIDGQWLVDEGLFLPSSYGITVTWEFIAGVWTVIKDGERIFPAEYQLSGNSINVGELEIKILSVSRNSLKAEMHGQEFIMKRK